MNPDVQKSAIVLSGGAAYASYEVGVVKALVAGASPATGFQPLAPDILTGTSAGAVNAAVLASYPNPREAVEVLECTWKNMASTPETCGNGVFRLRANPFAYLNPNCLRGGPAQLIGEMAEDATHLAHDFLARSFRFATSGQPLSERVINFPDTATLISPERLHRNLHGVVRPDIIREAQTKLRIAATNWVTGKVAIFKNSDFTDELRLSTVFASAAIPGVFPAHKINGVPHVDGTVVENSPLRPAITSGADVLHVIQQPDPIDFPPDPVNGSVEIFYRTIVIMLDVLLTRDIQRAKERNRDIALVERLVSGGRVEGDLPVATVDALIRTISGEMSRPSYRPVTLHRFRPAKTFGGLAGLLDFSAANISDFVDQGYQDAVNHDCEREGCVFPLKTGEATSR